MSQNGHALISDELVEVLEDTPHEESIIAGYERGESSEDKTVDFAQGWFPDADQWQGKTIIAPPQAKALAVARNLDMVFPELAETQGFIDNVLDEYEVLLTSIDGHAREQHEKILRAAFGDESLPEQSSDQSITIFQGDENDD